MERNHSHVLTIVVAITTTYTIMQRFSLRTLRSPTPLRRAFASVAPGAPPPQATQPFEVFDRQAKRRQKDRAAVREDGAQSRITDYLRTEVADRMFERFEVSSFSVA